MRVANDKIPISNEIGISNDKTQIFGKRLAGNKIQVGKTRCSRLKKKVKESEVHHWLHLNMRERSHAGLAAPAGRVRRGQMISIDLS